MSTFRRSRSMSASCGASSPRCVRAARRRLALRWLSAQCPGPVVDLCLQKLVLPALVSGLTLSERPMPSDSL